MVRRSLALLSVLVFVAAACPVSGQSIATDSAAADDSRKLEIARAVIAATRYAAFITRSASGGSSARTVDPLPPDSDFVVRFATNPRSTKVEEIGRDGRVTLYWFDATTLAYVSLEGTARIIRDAREIARHWSAEWTPHYPDRARGVALVEVRPIRIELVSLGAGLTGDSVTWAPPSVRRFRRPSPPRPSAAKGSRSGHGS